jgi:hypothetical protein
MNADRERQLYHGPSYFGRLTLFRGIGWTHSLHRHGSPAFPYSRRPRNCAQYPPLALPTKRGERGG